MRKIGWSGTGRRLFVAFTSLIALYAVAAIFALIGLVQIRQGLERTRERVEGLRVALDLASAVRDQYAHLAHTIIIGNESHLKLYEDARARVADLTRTMDRFAADEDERTWVSDIEKTTAELDHVFHDRILPGVRNGQAEMLQTEHHHVLELMARVQESTNQLTLRFEQSIDELQSLVGTLQQRALIWVLLFLLIAPILAGWAGITIGRSVAGPIARLKDGAERIAAGDLDTRIVVDSHDEFGSLARQFNAMTASLKDHQTQLVQSEKLAGIGRLAAGLAHEINNPLGIILGYARVLKKKADPALAADLGVIEEETLRCKEIVEGLLDLSRPLRSNAEPVDLREVCDDVAARLGESDRVSGVPVEVAGQGTVNGDAPRLRQVVFNLLKNAIEASGNHGHVAVHIVQTDEFVEVSVSDSGTGVAAAVRERLFEPFFTTKQRGTGLGLAVSQAIARAHGGEIVVESPQLALV